MVLRSKMFLDKNHNSVFKQFHCNSKRENKNVFSFYYEKEIEKYFCVFTDDDDGEKRKVESG